MPGSRTRSFQSPSGEAAEAATRMATRFRVALSTAVALALTACAGTAPPAIPSPTPGVDPDFAAYSDANDDAKLVRVSQHVWAAIGFDIGNIAFVVTDAGVLVFDTAGEVERAGDALAALREVTEAPIVGVVYSHGHGDHTGGVRAFIPAGQEGRIPIYAGKNYARYLRESAVPRGLMRAYYQMGYLLPKDETGSVGSGIGPAVSNGETTYLEPTVIVEDTLDLVIGGVRVHLFWGHTDLDDGLSMWLPDEQVMMVGDAAYPMLPAIATPRFEFGRQAWEALETLDHYRTFPIEHLVPGHLGIISGREQVRDFLRDFRDLVQYLHDQSIRAVNRSLDHDQAAAEMERNLPERLRNSPLLQERYHEFDWIARQMVTKAGGWWNGDVVELVRITPSERAERTMALIGSRAKVRRAAIEAFHAGDRGWAAELLRMLIRTDPEDQEANEQLARVLQTIAYDASTANLRHYLLTEARVLSGEVDPRRLPIDVANPYFVRANPDSVLFRAMGTRLDPVSSREVEQVAGFTLRDTGAEHTLLIRHGVIEWRAGRPEKADLRVAFDRETWIRIASGQARWLEAEQQGLLEATPNREALLDFMRHFDGGVGPLASSPTDPR